MITIVAKTNDMDFSAKKTLFPCSRFAYVAKCIFLCLKIVMSD